MNATASSTATTMSAKTRNPLSILFMSVIGHVDRSHRAKHPAPPVGAEIRARQRQYIDTPERRQIRHDDVNDGGADDGRMSKGHRMALVSAAFADPCGHPFEHFRNRFAAMRRRTRILDPRHQLSRLFQQYRGKPLAGPAAKIAVAEAVIRQCRQSKGRGGLSCPQCRAAPTVVDPAQA